MKINWFKISKDDLILIFKDSFTWGSTHFHYFYLLNYLTMGFRCKDCNNSYKFCSCNNLLEECEKHIVKIDEFTLRIEKTLNLTIKAMNYILNKYLIEYLIKHVKIAKIDKDYKVFVLKRMKS